MSFMASKIRNTSTPLSAAHKAINHIISPQILSTLLIKQSVQGSSPKKRMQASKVAPPQDSKTKIQPDRAFRQLAAYLQYAFEVANRLWCASRKMTSVIPNRAGASLFTTGISLSLNYLFNLSFSNFAGKSQQHELASLGAMLVNQDSAT